MTAPVRIRDLAIGEKFIGPEGKIYVRGKAGAEVATCHLPGKQADAYISDCVFMLHDLVFRAETVTVDLYTAEWFRKFEAERPRTGLAFMQAVKAMKMGKYARRPHHANWLTWWSGLTFTADDIDATDWEVSE